MEEISAFDILIDNLIDLGYKPEASTSNKNFIIPGNDRFLNRKYVTCALSDNIFFLASDSYGAKAHTSSTFTGLYSTINLQSEVEYKVVKKNWLDFIYTKRKRSKIEYIDKNLTILSSYWIPSEELNSQNVELFLKLNEDNPYSIIVENDYLPQIQASKGGKVIAIETKKWIYQKDNLVKLIEIGQQLITGIKNTCA